jgi:hypothetical protein
MKSNESNKRGGDTKGGMLTPGEPDAVKGARPVRKGEWRNVPMTPGEHRMATGESAPSLDRQRALLLPYEEKKESIPLGCFLIFQASPAMTTGRQTSITTIVCTCCAMHITLVSLPASLSMRATVGHWR